MDYMQVKYYNNSFLILMFTSLQCGFHHGRQSDNKIMGAGTGEQGGQVPTLEKIRVAMAHSGNFSRGLKTSWQ